MTIWYPVNAPTEAAQTLVADDSRDTVVDIGDLAEEFGDTYDIDQPLLDIAIAKVEEHLDRPLRRAEYKERLRIIYDGFNDAIFGAAGAVRPKALPVWSVLSPSGTTLVDGAEIRYVVADNITLGFALYTWNEQFATVTYEGGYTKEIFPATLRTIVLKVAVRMALRKQPGNIFAGVMPGINNLKVGDVGFSTTGRYGSLFDDDDLTELRRWRYRGET